MENGNCANLALNYDKLDYEYNILMSSMHICVGKHLMDEYFTVVWANNYFYEKSGYTKQEYESKYHNHCSEYFENDKLEYDKISNAINTAIENKQSGYECICKMPQKGGKYIWIKVVGTFTDEKIEGISVIYSAFTDITDLVQAQMEQTITYDNLPGFVAKFKVKNGFEFVDANKRFIEFFGKHSLEDPPYSIVNLDTEKNREVVQKNYPDMKLGKPVHFVMQVKDKFGNDAWLQINAECIDWIDYCPIYLFIYIDITDITEQRELQKKLEERSQMLLNALEMAEQANHAKSDFLSRMSHDIRTPMNAIMGMVAIAKESIDNKTKVSNCLDKIEISTKFLISLINDILDMSKIESGKMTLKKKKFDFVEFVHDITTIFYTQAEEKHIHFQVSTEPNLQESYIGDELKLSQIIINLLSNAIKFTDAEGSVELSISQSKCVNKSVELIFVVKDTGTGMDTAFLEKIFQPFEQENHQRDYQTGSGLGLAIAGNYARMMNGSIDVKSELNVGSTFTVHVWLELTDETFKPLDSKNCFYDNRILVVERNQDLCKYIVYLLSKFGAQAEGITSSKEALDLIYNSHKNQKCEFNMAIIDLKMPYVDGIELTKYIRKRFDSQHMIIAISAYDWSNIQERATEIGIDYFLPKPIFPSTIYDFLMSMNQNKKSKVEVIDNKKFSGENVLLVEDNDINLEIAQTLLELHNLKVEIAKNGREALERFSNSEIGHYWIILMDIQMPIMNGLDATKKIRSLNREDAKTIPIISMSADAFDEDVEKSLEAGMNAHVSKPIDISVFFSTLESFLDENEF